MSFAKLIDPEDGALAAALDAVEVVVAGLERVVAADLRQRHVRVARTVSRMKLPNGPLLFGGALATRLPQANDGAACTRVPSQTSCSIRRCSGSRTRSVLGSMIVASGNRYGIAPNPAVMRFAIGIHRVARAAEVRLAADDRAAFLVVGVPPNEPSTNVELFNV